MSKYYNPQRQRNMFIPGQPFKLSRSSLDLYRECPRCFYIDRRLGTGRPPGYPFTLNVAVDELLKKEFDAYRNEAQQHPLMAKAGIPDLVPASHKMLNVWRQNFKGVQAEFDGLTITGAIDDLWIDGDGAYYVVDYKATAKKDDLTEVPTDYGYQQQMEVYQWLLRKNGLKVSNTGFFVYANGDKSKPGFYEKLEFRMSVFLYVGDDSWVEPTIIEAHNCLKGDDIPAPGEDCDYCQYVDAVNKRMRL